MGVSVFPPPQLGHRKNAQNAGNHWTYSVKPTSRQKFPGFAIFYSDFLDFFIFWYFSVFFLFFGHPYLISNSLNRSPYKGQPAAQAGVASDAEDRVYLTVCPWKAVEGHYAQNWILVTVFFRCFEKLQRLAIVSQLLVRQLFTWLE